MRRDSVLLLLSRIRDITGVARPVIVGSQIVHAFAREVPPVIERSREVDILLEGLPASTLRAVGRDVGAMSPMADEHGVYADPVRRSVVALPLGWEERLVDLVDDDGNVVAACLDPVDASIAKLVAGRAKDLEFVSALVDRGLVSFEQLALRSDRLDRRVERLSKSFVELITTVGATVDERSIELLRAASARLDRRGERDEPT